MRAKLCPAYPHQGCVAYLLLLWYCKACTQITLVLLNSSHKAQEQSCEQFRHTNEKLQSPLSPPHYYHKRVSGPWDSFERAHTQNFRERFVMFGLLHMLAVTLLIYELNLITGTCGQKKIALTGISTLCGFGIHILKYNLMNSGAAIFVFHVHY